MRRKLTPRGPFSLPAAAGFGFGPTEGRAPDSDGAMRLAFPVDGGRGHAGVLLRQTELDGPVDAELTLVGGADPDAALAQAARTVSLDHDGRGFARLGTSDAVLGALQRAHPGQRPVLFHSPYEAAAWSIISARRRGAQGATVRAQLAEQLGATFELAGMSVPAFPQPDQLMEIADAFPGLNQVKIERLRAVAAAAAAGDLDPERLQGMGPDAAYADLQRLSGIGPFYASLIVLRASGFVDAISSEPEPKAAAYAADYYGLAGPLDPQAFAELAQRWRPFRTWAMVLIRLAGDRGTRI